MKTPQQIHNRKEQFLNNYNPMRTIDRAVQSGIKASVKVRQKRVYAPNISYEQKITIRNYWKGLLLSIGKSYEMEKSEKDFIKDIKSICDAMNHTFPDCFDSNNGFRIAQAQKSLSVFLKHMWCMDKIKMPPVCPIDRKIVGEKWSDDDMKKYLKHLDKVKMRNNTDDPLAVWELFEFYR